MKDKQLFYKRQRRISDTERENCSKQKRKKGAKGDKPGMRGTRLARASEMVRGQSGVSGASRVGLKISLYLILVVWEGTSSYRINVLTSSWNLLLKRSQTICV